MKNVIKRSPFLFFPFFLFFIAIVSCKKTEQPHVLIDEDFSGISSGPLMADVGAHTEYHYLASASPKTDWIVSTFRYNLPPSWEVRNNAGKSMLVQTRQNSNRHWHPMVINGSAFWDDFTIELSFNPQNLRCRNGVVFHYQNDRQYYFLGFDDWNLVLIKVNDGNAFREPNEVILASSSFMYNVGSEINLKLVVAENQMKVFHEGAELLNAGDDEFAKGKIGLLSDSPTSFYHIRVSTSEDKYEAITAREENWKLEQDSLIAQTTRMTVHRKMLLSDFGVGRSMRFGDLNGDGRIDLLFGQVVHHGPKDRNSELSCLTAMTFDGQILWQIGEPDPWKAMVTNDVAFQINDIDQDGKCEVVYCMNQELIVAEGSTGKTIKKVSTPLVPGGKTLESGHNKFKHILGDCIYFLDLQGNGYDGDFILKDRYTHLWAYDKNLKVLWDGECRTGHYPYAYDVDGDKKDEVLMGYSLFDDDGTKLWTLDEKILDHADGVGIVKFDEDEEAKIICAASDEGIFTADLTGNIIKHHYIGHVQNPAVANFRDDLPGLETVSVNFWGNQGIIHLFDKNGDIYDCFEPNQYGSVCLPLNWTGKTEEFFILNANAREGGAWDGYGRKVLEFPDDGHPDMCYAVMDITGDIRDEIVVWDPNQVWVYTQEDNPLVNTELCQPKKNPLYNYSNYQATISK